MASTTLQKILADNLEGILSRNGFSLDQYRALCKLSQCRTAALGGHAQCCSAGHLNGVWYNSCKHRAFPQCQGKASENWLLNTQDVLLSCPHHHVIFTLPESLNNLWRYNRELMSGLIFQAVQNTLKTFSRDPRYLAAIPVFCLHSTPGGEACRCTLICMCLLAMEALIKTATGSNRRSVNYFRKNR